MSRTSALWSIVLMSLMAVTIAALSVINWEMKRDLEACALEAQSSCDETNLQLLACRKILDAQMQFLEQER